MFVLSRCQRGVFVKEWEKSIRMIGCEEEWIWRWSRHVLIFLVNLAFEQEMLMTRTVASLVEKSRKVTHSTRLSLALIGSLKPANQSS